MAEHILLGLVGIIVFGVGAQWLAWRTKLPAILLLLIAGIIAGPITGLLNPDLLMGDLLGPFISISVGIILFEGGLSLKFSELRNIGGAVTKLVSIGVIVTLAIASYSAYYLFGLGLELSILLGAILVVTGPTVIIPLLRQVRPTSQVSNVLKWEGIVIDPIGAMLAVLVFDVILTAGFSEAASLGIISIAETVFFGILVGLVGATIVYFLLKRYMLPDFLQSPVTLMIVLAAFGVSDMLQPESGLWATTVMGIALANQKSARIHHIVEFKENLRVLLLSALFILLAGRIELSDLLSNLNWSIAAFIGILIFIARPLSVYLSTIGSNITWREKLFISWMAPRGVVAASIASLFSLQLVNVGYTEASQLVPIVFVTIISTVAIYGLTANWVARKLDVAKPAPHGFLILGAHHWAREIAKFLNQGEFKVLLADSNWSNINKARKDGLETYYGNILAEHSIEELNLDALGKLIALTPNDEVNSLAVIRYSEVFGTSEVYQLPATSQIRRNDREVPDKLSGRILFGEELNFEVISKIITEEGSLKIADIDQDFVSDTFEEAFGHEKTPLFLISQAKEAIPYSTDNRPLPQEGDKVIYLHNPSAQNEAAEEEVMELKTTDSQKSNN